MRTQPPSFYVMLPRWVVRFDFCVIKTGSCSSSYFLTFQSWNTVPTAMYCGLPKASPQLWRSKRNSSQGLSPLALCSTRSTCSFANCVGLHRCYSAKLNALYFSFLDVRTIEFFYCTECSLTNSGKVLLLFSRVKAPVLSMGVFKTTFCDSRVVVSRLFWYFRLQFFCLRTPVRRSTLQAPLSCKTWNQTEFYTQSPYYKLQASGRTVVLNTAHRLK